MAFWRRKKVTLDCVSCDTVGWELREESEFHRMWSTNTHVYIRFQLLNVPPSYPYDFTDIAAARNYYEQQSVENGSAMISVDFDHSADVDIMKGVFKYRSPEPHDLGMYFVGVLALLFRDLSFQINVESMETETTGLREVAVALLSDESSTVDDEPIMVESADEMFEHMRKRPVRRTPSDDEDYDDSFPDHPLSKVRSVQIHILRTLSIADVVRNRGLYRI